jgi:hypothetical protein
MTPSFILTSARSTKKTVVFEADEADSVPARTIYISKGFPELAKAKVIRVTLEVVE